MTDADRKRTYVADLYSGAQWKKKVGKMPDEQITAIYLKHQGDGEKPAEESFSEADEPLDARLVEDIPVTIDNRVSIDGPGPHHNEDDFQLY